MKVSPLISYKTAARVLALSGLMPVSLLPCIAFSLREINFARRCPCWLTAVPLIEGHAPAESGRYTETDQMCISRLISHLLPQLNAKQAACDASRSAMPFSAAAAHTALNLTIKSTIIIIAIEMAKVLLAMRIRLFCSRMEKPMLFLRLSQGPYHYWIGLWDIQTWPLWVS